MDDLDKYIDECKKSPEFKKEWGERLMTELSPALIATITKYLRYLAESEPDEYTLGTIDGVKETLKLLGIKLEGTNA
jgi:hypothetical protein